MTVEYTITNTGDAPLVLTQITTSCACAVAEFTEEAIEPGGKGFVRATFDAKALGKFRKSVGIYSNATPAMVYLHFTGEVVRQITDYSHQFTHAIGEILVDKTELDFPDVHQGENAQITLGVVNQSGVPYEPVLMHLPPYLEAKAEPAVLQKGERGEVTITLHTDRLADVGLTQSSVYLTRFAGDKISDENEMPVSVVLLPRLAETGVGAATPTIELSETSVDLSQKLAKKTKATHTVTVTNRGTAPLEISRLQLFDPAVGVNLKKNKLNPGEKTKLKITVDKQMLSKKKQPRILMITNDPVHTKVTIDLVLQQ